VAENATLSPLMGSLSQSKFIRFTSCCVISTQRSGTGYGFFLNSAIANLHEMLEQFAAESVHHPWENIRRLFVGEISSRMTQPRCGWLIFAFRTSPNEKNHSCVSAPCSAFRKA
jgi:hypothetical protein